MVYAGTLATYVVTDVIKSIEEDILIFVFMILFSRQW